MNPVSEDVRGRQDQFEALVRAWSADLYRYALWLCRNAPLAEDLVQETFMRAWRSLDSLRDAKAAKGWLITILRREHARLYERKRLPMTDMDGLELEDVGHTGPDDEAEFAHLRRTIGRLDRKYREPLFLQVVGGYSCAEIAQTLNLTKSAVMTQLFRARNQLQKLLQDDESGRETG